MQCLIDMLTANLKTSWITLQNTIKNWRQKPLFPKKLAFLYDPSLRGLIKVTSPPIKSDTDKQQAGFEKLSVLRAGSRLPTWTNRIRRVSHWRKSRLINQGYASVDALTLGSDAAEGGFCNGLPSQRNSRFQNVAEWWIEIEIGCELWYGLFENQYKQEIGIHIQSHDIFIQ